jgi:hypothetical protein
MSFEGPYVQKVQKRKLCRDLPRRQSFNLETLWDKLFVNTKIQALWFLRSDFCFFPQIERCRATSAVDHQAAILSVMLDEIDRIAVFANRVSTLFINEITAENALWLWCS